MAINTTEWTSWSGDIRFTPHSVEIPETEDDIKRVIALATKNRCVVRSVGARHSCSPIFKTDDILMSLQHFKEFYSSDSDLLTTTVGSGMTVEEVGNALHAAGLAMANTGHIDKQAIGGAISTHGAGKELFNLSGQVIGLRMINGNGELKEYNEQDHPEMMLALRVSLGSMGIITRVTLKVLPSYILHRKQYCASTEDCLEHLDQLMEENRNFCFYWYPRRDDVSIRLWNPPGKGTLALPFKATLYTEYTGWSKDVLPTKHELKYNELEYSVDKEKAPECFRVIRDRIKSKHRHSVGWRVLYRPIAGDNNYLSNSYGHDKVAITIHQNASLPYQDYFNDIEPIFRAFGGRPHWGKKHSLAANELEPLYPMWNKFHEIRSEMDPEGLFLNDHLKNIFLKH